jgi:hypothetical protein
MNKPFNSLKEVLGWKKNLELSSESIFIQYLNVIYSNLILREEDFIYSNPITKHRNSLDIKSNGKIRSNSLHKKLYQKNKNINKGISLKSFLEYLNIQEFIGKRIFKYLNKSTSSKLNKTDFSVGLNKIYCGDINNLIKFTFFLSDFNEDEKIYKSDMKLLLVYIPASNQKKTIKQINKIINNFFKNSEEGNDKEIDFGLYSQYILNYNEDNNNKNNSESLNDFNNNAPFFYFISILSYLFRNCPFNAKNVDYFKYFHNKKIKLMRNPKRSASLLKDFVTTAKKIDNTSYSNNNLLEFSSNAPLTIRPESKKFSIVAIPKIVQKNLFKGKRSSSQKNVNCDKDNEKYTNLINKKKKENVKNKD